MTASSLCFTLICLFALSGQVFPSLLAQLSDNPVEQGFLLSFLYLFFPVTSWYSGVLSDRFGKPPILAAGAFLMALPFLLGAAFSGIQAQIVCALFFGIGGGITESQATAFLCDIHPGRERRMVNTSQVFYTVGAMVGPALVAGYFWLFPAAPISFILLGTGIIMLVAGIVFIMQSSGTSQHIKKDAEAKFKITGEVALLGLSLFMYVGVEMGIAGWLPLFAEKNVLMDKEIAPLLLTCFWFSMAISRGIVALASGRISNRTILLLSLAGMLIFHIGLLLTTNGWIVLACTVLVAFSMGGFWPTLVSVAGARFKANSGAAVGIVAGCGAAGIPVIQFIVGGLSDIPWLGLRGALACLTVITLANIVLVTRIFSRAQGRSA